MEHKQQPIHEYNFTVASLATDLRDGVRLCRIVDVAMPPDATKAGDLLEPV